MSKPLLLILEDDATFSRLLIRRFTQHAFEVVHATTLIEAEQQLEIYTPHYALLDLKVDRDSGLHLIAPLKEKNPDVKIVVLTGYASISTAVEAIKLGATHYLAKPAEMQAILEAFEYTAGNPDQEIREQPLSVDRLEWEHIQRVLHENQGNVSATARALGMHRRTLQRKLNSKNPVRE